MPKSFIHSSADVAKNAKIKAGTKIWHQCHIRENAKIGESCILGKNVYVDHHVEIGNNVKIQNNCSIYFDCKIEDGAFIGPHVVVTNDLRPRAISAKGSLKSGSEWNAGRTLIKAGASIGAGSIILPSKTIGRYSMIGAGSVVTKNIPDYELWYGNPARFSAYVCSCGAKITHQNEKEGNKFLKCKECGQRIKK